MAANKFGRYIWLIDLIRCHPYITYKEISRRWEDCGMGERQTASVENIHEP